MTDGESKSKVVAWNPDDLTNPPCIVTPESPDRPGMVATPYGDLRFLNVRGNLEEMAIQLGTRLRDESLLGPVPFFADHLERVLANSPVRRGSRLLDDAVHRFVGARLKGNVPLEVRNAVKGFARVTDLDEDTVWRAYLMPEIFLWVLGSYHRVRGTSAAPGLGAMPTFGCTSAIVTPPRVASPLHGRNFDYFGLEYWDRFQTVTFYHPHDGLDYVSIAAAGIIGGGITSMNSAGLTFVVHQHFPRELDLSGVPVGVAGDLVMRHARTIEEAVHILRDHPPVSGWTYVMSEGDSGRAAVYEVAAGGLENLQWLHDGAMGYANVYWGEMLQDAEVDYYPEYRRCNYARQSRVSQCLADVEGEVAPVEIARILGDFRDPESGGERLLGPTIVNVMTVASVVFEPRHRRVWVGAGRSPASRGWFIPFDLKVGGPDMTVHPFIPFPGWHETADGKAFDFYRQACALAQEHGDDEKLLILVEHALALQPDEPYLRVLAGLVALRLGRGRRAEGAFRRALESVRRPDRRAEIGLFLAWSLDLQGQRSAAKHLYRRVAADEQADEVFRGRARYGRWFRFDKSAARQVNIDFTYGGVP